MLTSGQLAAVKADILADGVLNAFQNNSDGNNAIALAYAVIASPDFFVYRTNVLPQEIYGQVVWANLTPSDTPDGTQAWLNRAMQCQSKQFNLQTMLLGQLTIDASRSNLRAGLQDALTNVPAGAGGALIAAGWVGVRDTVIARKANRLEKLLNAGGGNGSTAALAATMGYEGTLSFNDVGAARNS